MWTVTVDENGEINLPEQVIESLGLMNQDYVQFNTNSADQLVMKKLPVKRVLVETISTFRLRYVVELLADDPNEYALDTVVMEDTNEFSQKHLDETIISHREVSVDEILKLCDEDNDYASSWPDDKKFEVFVVPLRAEKASKVTNMQD